VLLDKMTNKTLSHSPVYTFCERYNIQVER